MPRRLGLYELRINGRRVGDHVLAPDWTDYRKRVRYQVYDVASLLKPGDNALAALLGNGWYCGHIGNGGFQVFRQGPGPAGTTRSDLRRRQRPADRERRELEDPRQPDPRLRFHARRVVRRHGRRCPAGTCPAWTTRLAGGNRPREPAADRLEGQVVQPVRETGKLKPKSVSQPKPGRWTFDLGQNMVGVVRLKVSAPAGHEAHPAARRDAQSRTARSTPPISAAPRRSTPTSARAAAWSLAADVHLPRLPLRRTDRFARRSRTADAVTGIVLGSDTPRPGRIRLFRSAPQPASSEYPLGAAGQLPQHSHRLPAARRAAGLDGRRPGLHPHGGNGTPTWRRSSPSGWSTSTTASRPTAPSAT